MKTLNTTSNHAFRVVQAISRTTNIPLFKPSTITLDVTDRCQLKCQTCSKWKTHPSVISNELSTNQWKQIIFSLSAWLGPFWFTFSGGEPLLRKDIFELIEFAKEQNAHPALITNGYGFQVLAPKIAESGVESVTVSLNGINPSTHDTTRGVLGAFQKTQAFIKELNGARKQQSKPLRLSLNTILLPINYVEAEQLVNWVANEGLDGIHFQPMDPPGCFHSSPIGGINDSSLEGAGSDWYRQTLGETASDNLKKAIDRLVQLKKEGAPILNPLEDLRLIEDYYRHPQLIKSKCKLGISSFSIDPYGYVRFCFNMNTLGNVKYDSPESIFMSKNAWETRRKIKHCTTPCHWAIFNP